MAVHTSQLKRRMSCASFSQNQKPFGEQKDNGISGVHYHTGLVANTKDSRGFFFITRLA